MEAMNTSFYSLRFDPTGNQTRVYQPRLATRVRHWVRPYNTYKFECLNDWFVAPTQDQSPSLILLLRFIFKRIDL